MSYIFSDRIYLFINGNTDFSCETTIKIESVFQFSFTALFVCFSKIGTRRDRSNNSNNNNMSLMTVSPGNICPNAGREEGKHRSVATVVPPQYECLKKT